MPSFQDYILLIVKFMKFGEDIVFFVHGNDPKLALSFDLRSITSH